MNRNLSEIKTIYCGIKIGDIRSCRVDLIGHTTGKGISHHSVLKNKNKRRDKQLLNQTSTIN